jgi:hypothetical protein
MKLREWYLVLGTNSDCPAPEAIMAALRPPIVGLGAEHVPGPDWAKCVLRFPPESVGLATGAAAAPSILLFRQRELEEKIAWARQIVTANPSWGEPLVQEKLLEHLGRTKQAISIMPVPIAREARMARVCEQICGYLCRTIDGLIQVYQEGFFDPQGESLFPKNAKHRLNTS